MAVRKRAREWWQGMSRGQRKVVVVLTVSDTMLKAAALRDLRGRPSEEIRGSKLLWGLGLTVVNSVGALPLAYFRIGRRTAP